MDVLGGHVALGQEIDAMALRVFGGIRHEHGMARGAAFYKYVPGIQLVQGYRRQLLFQRPGAAVGEYRSEITIKAGAAFAKLERSRQSIPLQAGTAEAYPAAIGPFEEIEPDALFGIEVDAAEVVCGEEELGTQAHDRVGALLQVLVAHRNVQHGKLGVLIAFG